LGRAQGITKAKPFRVKNQELFILICVKLPLHPYFCGVAGIYFHIPFCKQACSYCDFHFSTTFQGYRSKLIACLVQELLSRKSEVESASIESIYFGGGTPSLLTIDEVALLLDAVSRNFCIKDNAEITLEANPDDISEAKLAEWKTAGINRLSIGVQSFVEEDLKWMNRAHNVEHAHEALKLAKKFNFRISLDLIYGLPAATLDSWQKNLEQALSYFPEHISAYCLTVEQKTALHQWVKQNKMQVANEEEQSIQFEELVRRLKIAGYEQYEISNFCRDGHYAVHNSNYWKSIEYLGIGPSAHSFDGKSRRWNVANNAAYIKGVESNTNFFEQEQLTSVERFNEYILTGLRTKWGVNLNKLQEICELPNEFRKQLDAFVASGDILGKNDCLVLSEKGKLLADYIASELFLAE
jgi:oxygen-independent coproporphyrinogen-3 oxidase